MRKLTANQNGFELVIVGVVIAVVAVLGVSGWLVCKGHYKTKPAAADSTASAKPPTTPTNSAPSTKSIQKATKYLTIAEWGASIPLPASIENAYYVVPIGIGHDSDGKPGAVFVSEHSLDSVCGTLTASGDGLNNRLGEIFRVAPTDIDTATAKPFTEAYPGGTTIDGWYYGFQGSPINDACTKAQDEPMVLSGFKSAVGNVTTTADASATAN